MARMQPVIPKLKEFSFSRSHWLHFSTPAPWAILGVRLISDLLGAWNNRLVCRSSGKLPRRLTEVYNTSASTPETSTAQAGQACFIDEDP
jgi:hypothetical protein